VLRTRPPGTAPLRADLNRRAGSTPRLVTISFTIRGWTASGI
jgi:hypothetical protein